MITENELKYRKRLPEIIRPSFSIYLNNLTSTNKTGRCVEVGLGSGNNAFAMLNKSDITLIGVDNYTEHPENKEKMLSKLNFNGRFTFLEMDSVSASKTFPDRSFEYVYIDGSHEYQDVLDDCNAWWPKVAKNGILAGHDWWRKEVCDAVMKFVTEQRLFYLFCVSGFIGGPLSMDLAEMCDWWTTKLR